MPTERRKTLVRSAVAAAIVVAVIVLGALFLDPGWAQAATQAAAALTAALWAASRTRPRVTLTLGLRGLVYLDLENVGKRPARQVMVQCTPPLPMHHDRVFGPKAQFGDMDPGQRYEIAVNRADEGLIRALEEAVFEVSFDATWGRGRTRSTLRLGGDALLTVSSDDYSTPAGRLAHAVEGFERRLDSLEQHLSRIARSPRPRERGGSGIARKRCANCHWDEFFVDHLMQESRFRCANCESWFDIDCACGTRWCEHSPAPRQCTNSL